MHVRDITKRKKRRIQGCLELSWHFWQRGGRSQISILYIMLKANMVTIRLGRGTETKTFPIFLTWNISSDIRRTDSSLFSKRKTNLF